MIENDFTILGIAETWLKDKVYIDGFVWIGNNGPIVGYRGSGGTGLLIHNSLANEITWIETNNHRITAAKIDDFLIICIYAPDLQITKMKNQLTNINETSISTFRGNNRHTIIDYIISETLSKIKYIEVPQLNTNHVLLLSHVKSVQIIPKQISVIPWYKLEGKELEAFQHRIWINFQNKGIYKTLDPLAIFNNIKSTIDEESK
ncbi:unnamed protein product [Blepharisma stoltei]|uniref:Uncharacterized protein n=1 Tax=Blepharisma stoltei TaxID=1481888 RepID=A0AAU9K7G1_9CILI|nr:unnamed protein product [Blepharisma stoltei]